MESLRDAWRFDGHGSLQPVQEMLAQEEAWTIRLNGAELVTLILTPTDLEDLAYGYLANEGLIETAQEVSILVIDPVERQIWVRAPTLRVDPAALGRRILTSCCGRGRPGLYFLNDGNIAPVDDPSTLPAGAVPRLVDALDAAAGAFRATGGVHSAALAHGERLIAVRSDVGRHNALDKLRGFMLREGWTGPGGAVVFSGRISAEIVVKVARMRIPFVLSNAAPTSLGRDLADELGVTAVGFARQGRFNLYTHPERMVPPG